MNEPVNLTNCDREPIHIPEAIQPHGALVVLNDDYVITRASLSLREHFGIAAEEAVGKALGEVISGEDARDVRERVRTGPVHLHPLYLRAITSREGKAFDAIVHPSNEGLVLEFEPAEGERSRFGEDLHRHVQTALAEIRAAERVAHLAEIMARQVRRIAGFDRVMVYRFDAEWNGEVVAESRREDIEPFLGLHYPASDIPVQARALYTKNWLRFIADRDYVPSPIWPDVAPPLDMSFSVLRSVSPIHLEYLRNMGVGASMSVSILKEGKLWGLVACHHYSPRRVPFEVRTACEMLGEMLSLRIAFREVAELEAQTSVRKAKIGAVVAGLIPGPSFGESLLGSADELMQMFGAGGGAIVVDDEVTRFGQVPATEAIRDLARAVEVNLPQQDGVRATDHVAPLLGMAVSDPVASGVIAMTLTSGVRRTIMLFRPEQVRTVNWAGDPAKAVSKGDESRLSPRGSFALWKQTVRGRSLPWTPADMAVARELRQGLLGKVLSHAAELLESNQRLRNISAEKSQQLESERAARSEIERVSRMKDDFVATLSHELRTPLNAIQGWTQFARAGDMNKEGIAEALEVIERNARAQGKMVEDLLDVNRITSGKLRLDVQAVNLGDVLSQAIETVQIAASAKEIAVFPILDPMSGIPVTGDPQRLQQVFSNLLNNAVKFTPRAGKVRVELKRVGSHVEASVRDNGQGIDARFLPHVFDRFRQEDAGSNRKHGGLGLGLSIVRSLVELHGGTVSVESAGLGQGATFTVSLPVRAVTGKAEPKEHPTAPLPGAAVDCDKLNLKGVRALVVDDEPDARELVRRLLVECGVEVTVAGSVREAIGMLEGKAFDVVVSDIGMPGEDGYALVRQMREAEGKGGKAKVPAIALTAYARPDDRRKTIMAGFQAHIPKPVEAAELMAMVASLTGRI